MAGDAGHPKIARKDETKTSAEENIASNDAAHVTDQSAALNDADETTADAPKVSNHKTKPGSAGAATSSKSTAAKRRTLSEAQRDELQANNRYDDSQPSPRRRVQHTVRARFAGTTPDGSIVLRFPNGETAIVPPPPGEYVPQHRYYRRRHPVIYEPRDISEGPPYQPFLLPGD